MAAKTDTPVERWTYAGKREATGGKLADAWETADGAILLFAKTGGIIGQRYELHVDRSDGVKVIGKPVIIPDYDAEPAPSAKVQEWTAHTRMIETQRRAETKAKKNGDAVREACEPLRAMMFDARTRPERAAMLAVILLELGV